MKPNYVNNFLWSDAKVADLERIMAKAKADTRKWIPQEPKESVHHGVDCRKQPHVKCRADYLHSED